MHTYEVTEGCYVPVGPGLKWKKPGQVVHLKAADAKKLSGFVQRLDEDKSKRSELNTPDVETHDHAVGELTGGQPEVIVAPVDVSELPTGTVLEGELNMVDDQRTDSEREADEQAALSRAQLAEQPPNEGVQT